MDTRCPCFTPSLCRGWSSELVHAQRRSSEQIDGEFIADLVRVLVRCLTVLLPQNFLSQNKEEKRRRGRQKEREGNRRKGKEERRKRRGGGIKFQGVR